MFVCFFVDASPQPEQHAAEPAPPTREEEDLYGEEVYNPPNDVEKPVVKETPVPEVINEVPNNVAVAAPSSSPSIPIEEAPKKSYASIVGFRKLFSSLHHAEHNIKFISLTAYVSRDPPCKAKYNFQFFPKFVLMLYNIWVIMN